MHPYTDFEKSTILSVDSIPSEQSNTIPFEDDCEKIDSENILSPEYDDDLDSFF